MNPRPATRLFLPALSLAPVFAQGSTFLRLAGKRAHRTALRHRRRQHLHYRESNPRGTISQSPVGTRYTGGIPMRQLLPIVAVLFLAACSDTPTETKAPPPEKPSAPITGRQAFQSTYPAARGWASDCQPLRIRSMNLQGLPVEAGKASAWEITYTSQSLGEARVYSWSAIEAEGNLHKGVFAGLKQSWGGPSGQERPFLAAAIKIDTTEALATAKKDAAEYLAKPGNKRLVTYLLESTPRFPDPAWRVMWGESVSAAEYTAFIDASTGRLVGHE